MPAPAPAPADPTPSTVTVDDTTLQPNDYVVMQYAESGKLPYQYVAKIVKKQEKWLLRFYRKTEHGKAKEGKLAFKEPPNVDQDLESFKI